MNAREAARLRPNWHAGHENVAERALALNRLDEAEAAVEEIKARNLDPEEMATPQILYRVAFLRGDSASMQKLLAESTGKRGAGGHIRGHQGTLSLQADTETYYGRLRNARDFVRRAAQSDVQSEKDVQALAAAAYQLQSAIHEVELGFRVEARRRANAAAGMSQSDFVQTLAAVVLSRAGDKARARALAAEVTKEYPLDTILNSYWLPTIRAAIALGDNDPAKALQELRLHNAMN